MVSATFPHASYTNPDVVLRCSSPVDTAAELACLWRSVQDNAIISKETPANVRLMQQSLLAVSFLCSVSIKHIRQHVCCRRCDAPSACLLIGHLVQLQSPATSEQHRKQLRCVTLVYRYCCLSPCRRSGVVDARSSDELPFLLC